MGQLSHHGLHPRHLSDVVPGVKWPVAARWQVVRLAHPDSRLFGIFLEVDLLRKSTDELASSRKIGDIRTTTLRRFMSGPLLALALRAAGAEEASAAASCPPEPNPPAWPPSVRVFSPDDPSAAARAELAALGEELNDRARGHFSRARLALLFKPGVYRDLDVPVGYYTQVLGLGRRAGDVVFAGDARGPHCAAADTRPGGAGSLDTFWRAAENFRTDAPRGMLWAVSQAAPLRRVHVGGDLVLHDEGRYASGGFMANVRVDGALDFGSQQQWCARNARVGAGGARAAG